MNYEDKRKWVQDYIIENQDCIKQDVVNEAGEKGIASRIPVLDIIKELVKEKIVTEKRDKPNSRNVRLTIDKYNPSVIIPKEIEEIEQTFDLVLKEMLAVYKQYYSELDNLDKNGYAMSKYLALLQNLLDWISDCYMRKCTLVWPIEIRNTKTLKDIIGIVMLTVSKMQTKLINYTIPINTSVKMQSYLYIKPGQSSRTYHFSIDLKDKGNYFNLSKGNANLYNSKTDELIDSLLRLVWDLNKTNWFELFIDRDPHKINWKDDYIKKVGYDPKDCSWDKMGHFVQKGFIEV